MGSYWRAGRRERMPLDGNGYVRDGANTVSEREDEDHNRSEMQPPWESNTALGIEEPECVYVYVPATVFGAKTL